MGEDVVVEHETGTREMEGAAKQEVIVIKVKQLVHNYDLGLVPAIAGENIGAEAKCIRQSKVIVDGTDGAVESEQADTDVNVSLLLVIRKAVFEIQQSLIDAFGGGLIILPYCVDAFGKQFQKAVDHRQARVLIGVSENGAVEEIAVLALDSPLPEETLPCEAFSGGLIVEGQDVVKHVDDPVIVEQDFVSRGSLLCCRIPGCEGNRSQPEQGQTRDQADDLPVQSKHSTALAHQERS